MTDPEAVQSVEETVDAASNEQNAEQTSAIVKSDHQDDEETSS